MATRSVIDSGTVRAPAPTRAVSAPLPKAPAPIQPAPPAVYNQPYNYGGGGGGYGGGALDAFSAPAQTDDQWLGGDSAYQVQLAALQRALSDSKADFTGQRSKYETDYNDSLKGLGWIKELLDDKATVDVNEAKPGSWNFTDLNTSAGRSFNNQQNDFASRGLLQSSLYGTAQDNLTRSLNDQLGAINTGRQGFLDDMTRQETSFGNENTLNQQQARVEALARRAAGLSL